MGLRPLRLQAEAQAWAISLARLLVPIWPRWGIVMIALLIVALVCFALVCAEPLGAVVESTHWGQLVIAKLGLDIEEYERE